jgi:cyanophycin synthetase
MTSVPTVPVTPSPRIDAASPRRALPLIAVTGAAGKSTTAWLLANLFESSGSVVGAWISSGVYLDGTLRSDELHAWELAVNAARAREIDVLIQEVPSVLATRLPHGAIQMAVITSICGSDQSCRRHGSAERELNAVINVIQSLDPQGRVVANADDLLIVDALEKLSSQTIYYALHEGNPVLRSHLDNGGSACWIDDGWVVYRDGQGSRAVVQVSRIPSTLAGHLSYQVQNVLAATAAALALGIDPAMVASRLSAYSTDPLRQPGTANLLERDGRRVIIDRPRSVWSLKQLVRSVRATAGKRVFVVTGCLPYLSQSEAGDAARAIAALGGVIVFHGENGSVDRRECIKAGFASAKVPPVTFQMDDEAAAIERVFDMMHAGDTAIILADDGRLAVELATS